MREAARASFEFFSAPVLLFLQLRIAWSVKFRLGLAYITPLWPTGSCTWKQTRDSVCRDDIQRLAFRTWTKSSISLSLLPEAVMAYLSF